MVICMGKSCSFGLPCVSFINVYQFACVCFFPFLFRGFDVGFDCIIPSTLSVLILW